MLTWYAAGLFVSILLAWLAAVLHASVRVPIGMVSIGVGLTLAVMLSTFAMLAKLRIGRRLIIGTVALAVVTVLAQHAWLYVDYRRQWNAALSESPKFADFRSEIPSPAEYFAHELTPARGALWCLDAALIITVAVGSMWLLERKRREFGLATDAKHLNPEP